MDRVTGVFSGDEDDFLLERFDAFKSMRVI